MYPVQNYINPYPQNFPQQMNGSSYPYHHHPSWNAMYPHMRMDSHDPPTGCEPWSHNSYTYPQCSSCCSHGHFGFRPPYTHFQPPSQSYYHYVPHPPYPNGFSTNFVTPPYFPMQQQGHYEMDKDQHHCCGCPNHKCKDGKDTSVKMGEENPEGEHIDREFNKVIQKPNYSHPTIRAPQYVNREGDYNSISESHPGYWFPFDLGSLNSMRQGGQQKKAATQLAHPKHQEDKEGSWSSGSHPSFWIPLDLSGLGASSHGEENGRQTGAENKKSTSSPIFWFPSCSKPETADVERKEVKPSPKVSEQLSPTLKILPLRSDGNENAREKPGVAQADGVKKLATSGGTEKESKVKTIPVVQVDENGGTKSSMLEEVKGKKEEKPVANEKKNQEATKPAVKKEVSQVKTSKLPPVCLRVDPLPKKKQANGNSRSPSSPGQKEKLLHENKDWIPLQQDEKEKTGDKGTKLVDVKWIKSDDEQKVNGQRTGDEEMGIVKEMEKHVDKEILKQEADNTVHASELENMGQKESKGESSTVSENVGRKNIGRVLSPTDASVIIQSAFRGYDVRRWQPLEKLREMACIRLQADEIRKKICDAEAFTQLDQKEKVATGETIMNLLLQLDTIQGLHPSIKEIRKSMAKELVCLQEKLDLLGSQASKEQVIEKVETEQPKDVQGLSREEKVETSPQNREHMDEKPADSDSLLAGQIESCNISLPSNEDLNSREGMEKENFEETTAVYIDGQSVPGNSKLENEKTLVFTKQLKEVQELQSEENAGSTPKFEKGKVLKAAENQDSDSVFESQFESSTDIRSNKEPTEGHEHVSDGAAIEGGCLIIKKPFLDDHEDQSESGIQETFKNMVLPDLAVIELPEFSENEQDSSGVSTGLQEEEKDALELAGPVMDNESMEVSKDMVVPDLAVILPEVDSDEQNTRSSTRLQKEDEKEEEELTIPVMNNASTKVHIDMGMPALTEELSEVDQEISKHKQNSSWASTDLQQEKEKGELELAAPVMNTGSTEASEITGLAIAETQTEEASCPEHINIEGDSLSKCLEELVESAKDDGDNGFGDSKPGVVTMLLSDAEMEAAHKANTTLQNETMDFVRLAGPTPAGNDYCTTMEELGIYVNTDGHCEVYPQGKAEENVPLSSEEDDHVMALEAQNDDDDDAHVMPSEEQNDDVVIKGNTTETLNKASAKSFTISNGMAFPQFEGTSADVQGELLVSPQEAVAVHSTALGSEEKKLLEDDNVMVSEEQNDNDDTHAMPSEEQNDDAFIEENTTEAQKAASAESFTVNETAFPQSEDSSADVQGDLLASPQEAVAVHSTAFSSEEKLFEENEKLREILERLLEAGKQQLQVISDLNGRVKHLERRLSQKGKARAKRCKLPKSPIRKTVSPAA